jgi:hypothetical protein
MSTPGAGKLPKQHRRPTSGELEVQIKEEDKALEEKYQRLLEKRQELDGRITETVKAMEERQMMHQILERLKAELEQQRG